MTRYQAIFTVALPLIFCASSFAADCLPLEIGTRFEALTPGSIIEVDAAALPETVSRTIVHRDPAVGWQPVAQWQGQNGFRFFRLADGLAPHATEHGYYAADAEFLRQEGLPAAPALEGIAVHSVALAPEEWQQQAISTGALALQPGIDGALRATYRGDAVSSRIRLESPALPVKAGQPLRLRLRGQLISVPAITTASLPGAHPDGSLPTPHEIEDQLSGVITNIQFRDGAGQIVPGPDWWELHRVAWAYPKSRDIAVMAPDHAVSVVFSWEFQGTGEVIWEVTEASAATLPSEFAIPEYHLSVAGKVTFPQFEIRPIDGEFVLPAVPRVIRSAAVAASGIEPEILLDGLRAYQPEIADDGIIRLGLWDIDADWRAECADVTDTLPAEGYVLKITPQEVLVLGKDVRGLFYGVQELGERLALGSGRVACTEVLDYPAQELRIVHQLLTWNHPTDPIGYYEKWLPELARRRINMFAFDVRRDWFELDQPEQREYWARLADLCRKWQIMPLPMGMNFRNLQPLEAGIQWAAAKWAEDEPYVLTGTDEVKLRGHADGYYVRSGDNNGFGFAALPDGTRPTLALTDGDNPFRVRSANGSMTYQRGEDYVIESDYRFVRGSNDFSLPGNSLTLKWPTGIRRSAGSRIPDGDTVLVSYNYLYRQRGKQNEHFSSCISDSAARQAAAAAMAQMLEVLNPEWVHINQDEIVGVGRDGRDILQMREAGMTPGALFAQLLEGLKDTARAHGVTNPVIAWSDNFTPAHAGWSQNYNGPYYLYGVRDHIDPADYLIDVWGGVGTAEELLENGYSILVAPLENKEAIIESAQYLADRKLRLGSDRVRGIQLSCWRAPDEANFLHLREFARMAWNPGPWAQWSPDGKSLRLYDLYGSVNALEDTGAAVPLHPAPNADAWWAPWRAGWSYEATLTTPPTAPLESRNARNYIKLLPVPNPHR